MVDNCYGEFVEKSEPTQVGADLIAGSMIKNAGGGIATTGGYIAGRKDLVEKCAYRLTTPGLGSEVGATIGMNRQLYMGLFFAPHTVGEALKSGLMNTKVLGVNIQTLRYQVPGGMLSNLVSQLKEMGQEDKYEQVLEEVPRVRKDFGEPPLVTPSSQIVGTQAVLNVVSGERYKMVTKESKKLLSGEFGQTVKPFNPEVQKKCLGDDAKVITCRPADLIKPQLADIEKEMAQ